MKTFFRVISYAHNFKSQFVLFFLYSILGIIFGAFNIVLVIPMLKVLFEAGKQPMTAPPIPEFSFSTDFIVKTFYHYFLKIINERGALDALLFVCALIVISVILA